MIDLSVEYTLDQAEALTLTVPMDDPKAYTLEVDKELEYDGRLWFVQKIEKRRSGNEAVLVAHGAPLWMRLNDKVIVGTLTIEALTVGEWLDLVLTGTGWTRGAATTTDDTVYITEAQDQTVLWWLRDIAAFANMHLRFDSLTKQVSIVETQGRDLGIGFRYGRNLQSIEHVYQAPRVTKLYPYGRDSISIADSNDGVPYLEDYSWYTGQGLTLEEARERFTKEEVFAGDDFITEDSLLAAAQAYLTIAAQPIVEYSMDVTDLSGLLGVTDLDVQPGDTVRVRDTVLNLDVQTTVVRVVRFPLEPARNTVELSYLYSSAELQQRSRTQATLEWNLLTDTTTDTYQMRNNNLYVVNRIPVIFAPGGEAIHGIDFNVYPVGTGSLSVSAMDAEAGTLVHPVVTIPFTNGVKFHRAITFAARDQEGQKDYQVRMVATASGGASSATGVNIDIGEANYWILARGGVERKPQTSGSQTFDYTGAVQTFEVPEGVTEVTIEAWGAPGGFAGANRLFYWERPGYGGYVKATFPVEPLDVLDVYVGGRGTEPPSISDDGGGWPNGGGGSNWSSDGSGGGGSSHVLPQGGTMADALIVAGGGGGMSPYSSGQRNRGGDAGLHAGNPGSYPEWQDDPLVLEPPYGTLTGEELTPFFGGPGLGAGQYGGGWGGAGALTRPAGGSGSLGQGGDANFGDPLQAVLGAAGGGGGYYGGGGGGTPQGPGGGGCGYIRFDGTKRSSSAGVRGPTLTRPDPDDPQSFSYSDATTTHGRVIISWKVAT